MAEINNVPAALGIDIGTTSISVQFVDLSSGKILYNTTVEHDAAAETGENDSYALDAEKLLEIVMELVQNNFERYTPLKAIGITGQMHGICCLDSEGNIISPLYTWQNKYGTYKNRNGITYSDEIQNITGMTVPTGYGLCTLYSLMQIGKLPCQCAKIATIMDIAAMRLCSKTSPITHPSNAASLGMYDIALSSFKTDEIKKLGIDIALLPEIVEDSIAGYYKGVPVAAAIGDNQAGIFGSLTDDSQVLVNVGTSSQVSIITNSLDGNSGELRPYLFGKCIRIGAALCGGKSYSLFADFIIDIAESFGVHPSRNDVYAYLNSICANEISEPLQIRTTFLGTRSDPSVRGQITDIGMNNFTPRHVAHGILHGIVSEVYEMYSSMIDTDTECEIVVSGNAMRNNPELRRITSATFGKMPLIPRHTEEAAFGAAVYSAVCAGIIEPDIVKSYIEYETDV